MTDVEAKTPTKRGLSDKKGKKGPQIAKKAKLTPEKQNKNFIKPNATQNQNVKKMNKKNSQPENGSPKKLKPFVGTAEITSNEKKEGSKKVAKQNEEKSEKKRRRNALFFSLKTKIESDEKETALINIEDKIKAIEGRGEISKSGKRKLKLLQRLKRLASGEQAAQPQQKVAGNKSKNQQVAKKKGLEASKEPQGKKELVKTQAKVGQKKQIKVDNKQLTKKGKQQAKVAPAVEESDDDEESDNELDEDEAESDEDEENGIEGESGDDSDDEEDEDEEDEEDDSEEDDSEEERPAQVSNKRQKKK